MLHDVVIIGGGPAGLSAALALGRARKRVFLCDAGPPRNLAAVHVHNFVTRDGTPPAEFRRIAREQLASYASVEIRDTRVESIGGERGRFRAQLDSGAVEARRVLLCTGMIDVLPELEGLRAFWGKSIFICPFCHAWEVRDRRFGVLLSSADMLDYAIHLRSWTDDLVVLTHGAFALSPDHFARARAAGLRIEEQRIARFAGRGDQIQHIELASGEAVPIDVLFMKPQQRQVPVVEALGLELDSLGFVRVGDHRETSRPGIYAGGDLVTAMQSAIIASASGMHAAAMISHDLTLELATRGSASR